MSAGSAICDVLNRRMLRVLGAAACLAAMLLASGPPASAEIRWKNGRVSAPAPMAPTRIVEAVGELAASRVGPTRVVVHFDGPLSIAERNKLDAAGLSLLSYLGGYAYFATLTDDVDAGGLLTVPQLRAVEAIDPVNKLHPDLEAGVVHPWAVVEAPTASSPVATVAVYGFLHKDVELARAAAILAEFDAELVSTLEPINAFVAHLQMDRVDALAAHHEVMYVEPPLPLLEELNDSNRQRTQSDTVNQAPYNLDGSGITVLVYDGGKVATHGDLAGRLTIGAGDGSGTSDHATHVACTIGGDGSGNSSLTGMAPGIDVVSYGFEGGSGFLYTNPGDLESDYSQSINTYGADISNNSIGTNTAANGFPCSWEGNYGATGALIDEIVRGSLGEPFRVVWANGNERSGGGGRCGTTYLTTAPPACAKNHMTVGAMNSNDDSVTGFTSWGPCDDGRIKPDVSAPGCQSNDDGGVSSCSSSGGYNVKCGTSMASPTAAGVAALLLQQYRLSNLGQPDFRNSTLRAILAQTAEDLENPGPDYKTGYGSIRAVPAVDLIQEDRFLEDVVVQGQTYEFTMDVGTGAEVKVTLAWDDPAGTPDVNPVLVNDVDLRIIGPTGTTFFPWTLDPADPGADAVQTQRDGVNNIEQVRIANAAGGTYRVQVIGFNIAEGPDQPFSVATSHEPLFCTAEPTFSGVANVTPGASCGEIQLSWLAAESNCDPAGAITYNVYRSTNPFFLPVPGTLVKEVGTTATTDVGLEPGTTYHYIVRAKDSLSGEDTNTTVDSATSPTSPDAGAPIFSGLETASPGGSCGEVVLGWQPALETCSGPVTYEIHRSTNALFTPGPDTLVAATPGTAFIDTSVTPGAQHTYVVRARDDAGNVDPNEVRNNVVPTLFDVSMFQTGFEPNDEGWTLTTPNDATAGTWAWGDPESTSWQPENDDSDPGVNCWITGLFNESGNGDVDDGTTTLLSATYDMTGAVNPAVNYSRWFTNDRGGSPGDPTDTFRIDVSNDDGANWTSLEEIGEGTPLEWVKVSLPMPIAVSDEVRFRFTASDLGAGSLVEAGIDEFSLVDAGQACLQCTTPPAQTLCEISVDLSGDDVIVDWSTNPVGTRAVVYHVGSCDPVESIKLGTSESSSFVHESAALSSTAFNYRVTFVDECGNELAFCGATDCP